MIRIPLLKDNHNHLFTYSNLAEAESLFYITNKKIALAKLSNLKSDSINIVTGWFDSNYQFSEKELNDCPPLIICNNSLHKYLINNKAAVIIEPTFPEWIENNSDQLWVEKNIMKILSFISDIFGFDENTLHKTLKKNLKAGVCFASDMFVTSDKVFSFLSKINRSFTEVWTDPELFPNLNAEYKNLCRGVKLFTDGALGGSTAATQGYKSTGNIFLSYSDKCLNEKLEQVFSYKTDVSIHCIGEIAIEQVIRTLAETMKNPTSVNVRLEHVQFITEKQAKKAKDLGLILSMQPNFNMDSVIYSDRLTTSFCESNNPFRMLIDRAGFVPGKDLIFGSDGMPTGIEGTLQESLFPPVLGQKISLEEFVAAYCTNNFDLGYIDVYVDQLKNKVITEVVLT